MSPTMQAIDDCTWMQIYLDRVIFSRIVDNGDAGGESILQYHCFNANQLSSSSRILMWISSANGN